MSCSKKTTAFASILMSAVVTMSPYLTQPSSAETVRRSLSTFAIAEEKVGKKTFQTSKILIKAPPARVFDVLTNYEKAADIFSNLVKSRLVSTHGPTKRVAFTGTTVGNLFKFDYTLDITEKPHYIEWKRHSGAFKANEGYWRLDPVDGGSATLVTYAKHIDGGWLYPQGLVNKSIRESIPVIFAELKSESESPAFVAASN